ncbi:unnamed protein product [Ranitomeya imitator]|uniref:Uncharacterized protein n=1 Tax=Ranitomeya imitator TaxID=111125 RepID=A0ABN9KLZ7_9NEOB|nr:unnamed protein product [Ranitomeya imitator]
MDYDVGQNDRKEVQAVLIDGQDARRDDHVVTATLDVEERGAGHGEGTDQTCGKKPAIVSVIILYPKCQCHYPVPQVSVSLSCTPSVSVIILYPECQCHYPVPRVISPTEQVFILRCRSIPPGSRNSCLLELLPACGFIDGYYQIDLLVA